VKFLKAFGQFWYDFIIGDDWKIAAAVLLALVVLFVLTTSGVLGDTALTLLGGALIVVAFSISLAIDVRPKKR
jgi:Na+-translocating ferredoxin:NAD+ oxidoreductase RnfD subunit